MASSLLQKRSGELVQPQGFEGLAVTFEEMGVFVLRRLLALVAFSSLASIIAVGCAAPAPDETEPMGETEDALLAGRVLTPAQVAGAVRRAGFPENMVGKMVCTAKWESSFYERAKNGSHYGLFQISKLHFGESGCPNSVEGVYPMDANAKCAYSVYKRQGLRAWVAYTSHKAECDRYKAPGSAAAPDDSADDNDAADNDDVTPGNAGGADDNGGTEANPGDACYSPSIDQTVEEDGCVQSKKSGIWFQCQDGKWYRGGNASNGPYGKCTSSHPTK